MLESPPAIEGYELETDMQLHKLAEKRIRMGRDLKIIITAEDSETGVGKTTAAGWLALSWSKYFTENDWFVEPDEYGIGLGTVNPKEYFRILKKIPDVYGSGAVVVVDDAEELDARRSMQNLNVKFSQRWMLMRLKQAITIITLPSPTAIDSRLEELADVWINITARGSGVAHDIRVQSYGSRKVMTAQAMNFTFPNISNHDELKKLRNMKQRKIEAWDEEDEEDKNPDPKEVTKEQKIEIAQRMREQGVPIESQDPEQPDISSAVGMSQSWISKNTKPAN